MHESANTEGTLAFLGAATHRLRQMLGGASEAELRRRVCSPNGTTERAINSFEEDGLRETVERRTHIIVLSPLPLGPYRAMLKSAVPHAHRSRLYVQQGDVLSNRMNANDTNQLLSLMHATYALAYLNVARHLVADQDIVRMVGVQPQELMHELQEKQDGAVQKVCAECPQLQPASGRFTAHTGWLG